MENTGLFYVLVFIFAFTLIAFVLGIRDEANAKKNLIYKLKKNDETHKQQEWYPGLSLHQKQNPILCI